MFGLSYAEVAKESLQVTLTARLVNIVLAISGPAPTRRRTMQMKTVYLNFRKQNFVNSVNEGFLSASASVEADISQIGIPKK